jgi:hypothetical protein
VALPRLAALAPAEADRVMPRSFRLMAELDRSYLVWIVQELVPHWRRAKAAGAFATYFSGARAAAGSVLGIG